MTRELPIFPLPLVLFPGVPQALHIFEPRYRELLSDCLAADRRFGIARADGDGEDAVPRTGQAGCIALIRSTQPLPDGRSNIVTVGEERFVLQAWLPTDRPYRIARVAAFDDDPPEDAASVDTLAAEVRRGFGRLVAALALLADRAPDTGDLPQDPGLLSFHVAAALDLDLDAKQTLLESRQVAARLRHLAAVLATMAPDAEERATVHGRSRGNGKGGAHPHIERTS